MGVRGEIFSNKVMLPNRTYFFNVKENRMGDIYLNIVESKNRDNGGFDRQSVIMFADDLQEFLKGFDESLRVLEKAVREKRHSVKGEKRTRAEFSGEEKPAREDTRKKHGNRDSGDSRKKYGQDNSPGGTRKKYGQDRGRSDSRQKHGRDRDNKDTRQRYGKDNERGDRSRSGENRRVVVKKRDKQ